MPQQPDKLICAGLIIASITVLAMFENRAACKELPMKSQQYVLVVANRKIVSGKKIKRNEVDEVVVNVKGFMQSDIPCKNEIIGSCLKYSMECGQIISRYDLTLEKPVGQLSGEAIPRVSERYIKTVRAIQRGSTLKYSDFITDEVPTCDGSQWVKNVDTLIGRQAAKDLFSDQIMTEAAVTPAKEKPPANVSSTKTH